MIAVFGLCIAVQYNDPDPWMWTLFYAVPGILSIMALFRMYTPMSGLFAILYAAGFVFLMPWGHLAEVPGYVSTVHMTTPDSEYAREGIGLLIAAAWMAFLAWKWHRDGDDQQSRVANA